MWDSEGSHRVPYVPNGVLGDISLHQGNSIGNVGKPMRTFKNPIQNALIRWDEQSTPSSCKHLFSSVEISFIGFFFELPKKFRRP